MTVATDEFGLSFHTTDLPADIAPVRPWSCRNCAPIVARGTVKGWRIVVTLHGVECPRPVLQRTSTVYRQPAWSTRSNTPARIADP
jgi:hypothetical protein